MYNQDSPLSITASIAGILTLVTASKQPFSSFCLLATNPLYVVLAATYARITYLRTASTEYFRVKASLSWYKTESTFLQDLISSHPPSSSSPNPSQNSSSSSSHSDSGSGKGMEYEMYTFVMEQLKKIEERLLELLSEAEKDDEWTLAPRDRMEVAVRWAPVRAKALELVRQRDALGNRVLFAQMSMLSSYVSYFLSQKVLFLGWRFGLESDFT
jgi:hypothetical protein